MNIFETTTEDFWKELCRWEDINIEFYPGPVVDPCEADDFMIYFNDLSCQYYGWLKKDGKRILSFWTYNSVNLERWLEDLGFEKVFN